jgi:Domain of unknown function (DUF4055)
MPVDTRKSDYREAEAGWQRCRDCFAGSDAVKRRGVAYLPQVEGMVADRVNGGTAYAGYLARALFYPAMQRTVAGLAGLVFAKPPTAAGIPQTFQPVFDDVTLSGVSLLAFGLDLCQEILTVGRVGLLLDLPEAVVANATPYWVKYQAEQILNWQSERINGRHVLTQVVLCEFAEEANPNDEWDILRVEQFRVLQLRDGVYQVERYRRDPNDRTKFVQIGERAVPLRRGQPLRFIPFTIFGPSNIAPPIETPPLLALADVNLSHFRTSADHEHGAHFTALPTPWVSGHTLPANETLAIGSGTAWVFPQENARVGMLEFTGAGLSALANLKEEKRLMMVSLGARMLETQRNVQEAAQTVRLRHAGERSAMSVLADTEGQGLTQVVRRHLWWSGLEDAAALQAKISLNPDSMDELSADDIRALVSSWQAGAISHKTLLYNLQWGEWLPPGVSADEEIALIGREPGSLPLPEVA